MINRYDSYELSAKEKVQYILSGLLFIGILSAVFYDSIWSFLLMLPLLYPYIERIKLRLCKKRKRQLEQEFREMIMSVDANLQAGYSVENAFRESYKDIVQLYGKESDMAKEIYWISIQLQNNQQLEELLKNLAKRSDIDDIRDFAQIFAISKRSGGDLRAIISNTANILEEKREVRREIQTIMSEKELEQKIMRYIPFVIVGYISITSKGFFEKMYHNVVGIVIMTVCMLVYIAASMLAEKILDIEI